MKSYLVYKNQVRGIKDVSKTVKTVEKIAASSIHLLKQEVSNLNAYATEVDKVLSRLALFYQKKDHRLTKEKKGGRKTLIILTGDKGLVGGLWHNVVNTFLENVNQYQSVVVVGAKGENYLKEENISITKAFTDFSDNQRKEKVEHITNYIFDEFEKGTFSQIDILYPRFVSLVEQTPNFTKFLPFKFILAEEQKNDGGLPIFEPSKQRVFDGLLHKYIGVFFYKIIMETKLSELSARTVAMKQATSKTEDLIRNLTLDYTKERRLIVTQRQLESFIAHKVI